MDWIKSRIAVLPEVRLHWMHEFTADQDDFLYNVNGVGFLPFSVRSRDENLFRLGARFDMWSWEYKNTKFELDYDGLFSSSYTEHIFSGKIFYRL